MNQEKLKFVPGEVEMSLDPDGSEAGAWVARIHVVGEEVWLSRIEVFGYRQEDAEALRDRLLWALEQPTVPAQWQYWSETGADWGAPGGPPQWVNLDHGGEAAMFKGQGFKVRSLYAKPPLKED